MMFGKKGPSLIDYTELQRRGFIKKEKRTSLPIDPKSGMIDLTKMSLPKESSLASSQSSSEPSLPSPQSSQDTSVFSLLDNPTPTSQGTTFFSPQSNISPTSQTPDQDNLALSSLKNKVEDVEFKIDRLLERLAEIESRINRLGEKTK